MNQKFSIVAALSLSFLALSGCKKDEKAKESNETPKAEEVGKVVAENTEKPSAEVAPRVMPNADVDVHWKHMPMNVEGVLSVNINALTETSLWAKYGDMATKAMNDEMKLSTVKEKCGLDVLATLKSVHFGYNSANDEPIIMVKGIERSVANKCIVAMAKEDGKTVTITDDGPISVVTAEEKTSGIAWIDDTTLLFVPEQNDKEYLLARIAGTDGMDGNTALVATVGKVKKGAPIWFAGKFGKDSKAGKNLAGMTGGEVKSLFGGIGFADGLQVNMGVEFGSEGGAAKLKAQIEQYLPMGAMMVDQSIIDKVKVGQSGSDLTVDLNLSAADVSVLENVAKSKLGLGK